MPEGRNDEIENMHNIEYYICFKIVRILTIIKSVDIFIS